MRNKPDEIEQRLYDYLTGLRTKGVTPENVPVLKADYDALQKHQGRAPSVLGVPIVRTPDPGGVCQSYQPIARPMPANGIRNSERGEKIIHPDEFSQGGGI
jgi:hypothetical protein